MTIEIYTEPPANFKERVQIAGCYLEFDDELLLLQRAKGKSEPETWGVPAGKLEKNESPESAAKRELFEETGYVINCPSHIKFLGSLFCRNTELDFIYYLFKIHLEERPVIRLSDEHLDFMWASFNDCERIPLISGAKAAWEFYRKNK